MFSILDHLGTMKMRVFESYLGESYRICSAAGAICASSFNQSDGSLTIENSLAKGRGGVAQCGTPWSAVGGSFEMLLELALRLCFLSF